MASRWGVWTGCAPGLVLLALSLGAECGTAQQPPQTTLAQTALPQSTNDALHAMTQLAGVIFTGQVVGVRRLDAESGATGVVEIAFAVEDAVRGVSESTYTVREWAGLWPVGDEPFQVGQRFLMLLHAPSAAGLSSPVGGMDGAIPIRGGGAAVGPQTALTSETVASGEAVAGTAAAETTAPADGRVVDLRWVATRVVHPLSYRTGPVVHPTGEPIFFHADAVSAGRASRESAEPASGAGAVDAGGSMVGGSIAAVNAAPAAASQSMAYTTVLGMLRSWEKSDHATR